MNTLKKMLLGLALVSFATSCMAVPAPRSATYYFLFENKFESLRIDLIKITTSENKVFEAKGQYVNERGGNRGYYQYNFLGSTQIFYGSKPKTISISKIELTLSNNKVVRLDKNNADSFSGVFDISLVMDYDNNYVSQLIKIKPLDDNGTLELITEKGTLKTTSSSIVN